MDFEDYEARELKEQASDEDTEDASEAECEKKEEEFTGIKEQMYRDKLAHLRRQLEQLRDGTLPLYLKKLKKLNQHNNERINLNRVWSERQLLMIQEQYEKEKAAAAKEFEDKKVELRESLIQELEMKRKMIENERNVMELTGDTMAVKPVTTRKLRRRPNDPAPVPEKRGKPSPVQLTYGLDDSIISDDIFIINRLSGKPSASTKPSSLVHPSSAHGQTEATSHEAIIEDGRLMYDKRWFSRDQTVIVESKDHPKINATIISCISDEVTLKKIMDNCKLRITLHQLQTGYYTIRKRTM